MLGDEFTMVENVRVMQMRLFVFVNSRAHPTDKAGVKAMKVEKMAENVGLVGIVGNKGGVQDTPRSVYMEQCNWRRLSQWMRTSL